jgi:hypothetical protein
MTRVLALVEGQTEETFIKELLAPHLREHGVYITPIILQTRSGYKGGLVNYDHVIRDLRNLFPDQSADVTTMFDLYRLPNKFPGYGKATGQGAEKATFLEQKFAEDVHRRFGVGPNRFIPYFQVHEFEALLFSAPQAFGLYFPTAVHALEAIAAQFSSPEDIDETETGAPSKRITAIVGENAYEKLWHGPLIAMEITLEVMRAKCPHFNRWLSELER